MDKTKKINILTGIVLAGFLIAIAYHYILGTFLHLNYPYNTFLFKPNHKFTDFNEDLSFPTLEFNPYITHTGHPNYFPFGMLYTYFLRFLPHIVSLSLFYLIVITYFIFYNFNNFRKDLPPKFHFKTLLKTLIISCLSYPFLIWFDRGNLDGAIFIFISLAVYFFIKEKYTISSLIFSIPIAMKGTGLLLLPLLLAKKKFKEFFYCLFLVLFLTIISLLFAKGGVIANCKCLLKHMHYFSYHYIILDMGLGFSASLFGVVKVIIYWINGCIKSLSNATYWIKTKDGLWPFIASKYSFVYYYDNVHEIVSKALKIFLPIAGISTLAAAAYSVFIEKELWKQVLLLLICSIIFSPVSADYKLLTLYIPLCLFLNSKNKSKNDIWYTILFGLILIPKNYLQFLNFNELNYFNISIILNPIILLIMTVMIITEGFKSYKTDLSNNRRQN